MEQALIDNLVVVSAIIYYAFLCLVYLLRVYERDKQELMLGPIFSFLLVPFVVLWILNLLNGSDMGRLVTGLPIIIYLVYDLWYRLITKKKPQHHPDRWPVGLIVYLILLQIASIALNWYGFLVSQFTGRMLVISYFVMLGCFGFYQNRYNKRKKACKTWWENNDEWQDLNFFAIKKELGKFFKKYPFSPVKNVEKCRERDIDPVLLVKNWFF